MNECMNEWIHTIIHEWINDRCIDRLIINTNKYQINKTNKK